MKKEKGFTLLEVMLVVICISILVAIFVPKLTGRNNGSTEYIIRDLSEKKAYCVNPNDMSLGSSANRAGNDDSCAKFQLEGSEVKICGNYRQTTKVLTDGRTPCKTGEIPFFED